MDCLETGPTTVVAVGVTTTSEKVLLESVRTATENGKVCAALLRDLVGRGLRAKRGLLVVTDEAKALHAAVRQISGAAVVLQWCQWHKRENVVSYVSKSEQAEWRRRLQ